MNAIDEIIEIFQRVHPGTRLVKRAPPTAIKEHDLELEGVMYSAKAWASIDYYESEDLVSLETEREGEGVKKLDEIHLSWLESTLKARGWGVTSDI